MAETRLALPTGTRRVRVLRLHESAGTRVIVAIRGRGRTYRWVSMAPSLVLLPDEGLVAGDLRPGEYTPARFHRMVREAEHG